MIVRLRRRATRVLARLAILVSPDQPLTFTTRRIEVNYYPDLKNAIVAAVNGGIGGRVGLGIKPDVGGTPATY